MAASRTAAIGGTRVAFHEPLRIGDEITRVTEIADIRIDDGPNGVAMNDAGSDGTSTDPVDAEEAERLAREAVAIVSRTDYLEVTADAHVALATVLEAAGVSDVLSKSLGSSNPINIVHATVAGRRRLRRRRFQPWAPGRTRRSRCIR